MRTYLFLLFLVIFQVSNAQEKTIFQIKDGNIIVDSSFIEEPYCDIKEDNPIRKRQVNIMVGKSNYNLNVIKQNDYRDETGDFEVISFHKNDSLLLEYRDVMGLLFLNNKKDYFLEKLQLSGLDNICKEVIINDNLKLLFFFSFNYGTDLSRVIIFALTEKEVKLVFNKRFVVMSFMEGFETLELGLERYNDNEVVKYKIWRKDGVLKFKHL